MKLRDVADSLLSMTLLGLFVWCGFKVFLVAMLLHLGLVLDGETVTHYDYENRVCVEETEALTCEP